jgi:hypothetical protein
MAKPARLQILERARALIEDERHWCPGNLARDARGLSICPTDSSRDIPTNNDHNGPTCDSAAMLQDCHRC